LAAVDRENLKRQVRDAVDIVDLIGSYMTLRRAGSAYKGLCPFHDEKTPSFTVSPVRQTFKCFGCGAGGDVFSFVQLKENIGFPEALRLLADRAGISLEPAGGSEEKNEFGKRDLAKANEWAQRVFHQNYAGPQGQAARDYVAKRGLSAEMVETFGLGFALDSFDGLVTKARSAGMALPLLEAAGLIKARERGGGYYDTFRNRLMFPIVDATGRIIGFGGRTLGDDPAKYLNSPATALFDKSVNLFGLNLARQEMAKAGRAIVVEGYTDCMMAHQFGFTETVATLGTAMTEQHAAGLRRYTDRVVLLFDSDEAGQRAADRALSVALSSGLDVSLAKVPEGKDPCDYLLLAGRAGMETLLKQALGALEFKWNLVASQFQAGLTGPSRRRAMEAYLQQLAGWLGRGVINPIQKGLLVNNLSRILSVPADELHRELDQLSRQFANRVPGADGLTGAMEPPEEVAAVGAEQRALQQVIEALLNEPAWYPVVEAYFEPTAIRDRKVAAIAVELVNMLRSGEPFQISELIGRFESPEYGRLITDLQARGERRGRYGDVINGAIPCLQSCQQARRAAALAEEIRRARLRTEDPAQPEGQAQAGTAVPAGEDERLIALGEVARNPGFSTVKLRKRFL